ncbi:MAG: hypothetical protein EHM28_12780, partial [Spirochaetaceae bacterium]
MNKRKKWILLTAIMILGGCFILGFSYRFSLDKYNAANKPTKVQTLSDAQKTGLVSASEQYCVVVYKESHLLQLVKLGKIIRQYSVNVRTELDDRTSYNDGQTPEGVFPVYELAIVTKPAWTRWIAFNTAEKA